MFGHNDEQNNEHTATVDPNGGDDNSAHHTDGTGMSLPSVPNAPQGASLDANAHPGTGTPVSDDDLLNLKREALEELAPLVGHLNQSPEEKFKTTMMMIQATDDSGLIKDAYKAAKEIGDEKVRAQALLDIVNEINYFTQHSN